MASKLKIKVNGLVHNVTASLDTPLLYVLHNELHLHGPRFGCGLAQCGACSVLLDGKEIRSCVTPVAAVSREGDHDAGGPAGSVGEGAGDDGGFAGVASVAAGVDRCAGAALRLLPERDDDPGCRSALDDEESDRGSDPDGDERPSLPLWHLSAHPDGDQAGRLGDGEGRQVTMTGFMHEKEFSRKSFLKGGGALVVGFSVARLGPRRPCRGRGSADDRLPARPDPGRLVDQRPRRQLGRVQDEPDRVSATASPPASASSSPRSSNLPACAGLARAVGHLQHGQLRLDRRQHRHPVERRPAAPLGCGRLRCRR